MKLVQTTKLHHPLTQVRWKVSALSLYLYSLFSLDSFFWGGSILSNHRILEQPHNQEKAISQGQRVITPLVETEGRVEEQLERSDQQAKTGLDEPCQSRTQVDESLLSRIEKLEQRIHWITSDVDDAINNARVALYDFRKEMNILKEKFSEDCQELIDGLRKDLEGQLMEEMREKRDEIMNTIFHGDNYRLDIFFGENRPHSVEEAESN
jgi:uncharacterized protein (UPF0335 family)